MRPLNPAARLAVALALLLAAGGCLVNEDEFDRARQRKESLGNELSRLRQDNDRLNHEINRLYTDREILSGHVAMTAAVALHNGLTARLRPAQPTAAPARPAQTTRPATTRPAQAQPAQPPVQTTRPAQTQPPPAPPVRNLPGGAVDLGGWGQ